MHVLEAALFSTFVNSPRTALLDYPASEWREIRESLDAALEQPARPVEPVRARTAPAAFFRRWLTGTAMRNRPVARNVA